jgi:hypothetical protein
MKKKNSFASQAKCKLQIREVTGAVLSREYPATTRPPERLRLGTLEDELLAIAEKGCPCGAHLISIKSATTELLPGERGGGGSGGVDAGVQV